MRIIHRKFKVWNDPLDPCTVVAVIAFSAVATAAFFTMIVFAGAAVTVAYRIMFWFSHFTIAIRI